MYECMIREMAGDCVSDKIMSRRQQELLCTSSEGLSDSALEHCSSVLQEMGYGDMVSASLTGNLQHFHGN